MSKGQYKAYTSLRPHFNSVLKFYMSQNSCVHRKGTSCLCMFYEISWNIFLLWLLLLVKYRKCQYRWKIAEILPYQSFFFLSELPTPSSTLASEVMTYHTDFNLLDIFNRSTFSDVNLSKKVCDRFSTQKIYMKTFFNINSHVTVQC